MFLCTCAWKALSTLSTISLPPCRLRRHPPFQGWIVFSGGLRPPNRQPSLDREGVDEVDGWDDRCFFFTCGCKALSAIKHQSSPHRFAEPPFQGWLFQFTLRMEGLSYFVIYYDRWPPSPPLAELPPMGDA